MSKVLSENLTTANKSPSIELLDELSKEVVEIRSKIESFIDEIGDGKPLTGEGYNAIKIKFELYIESLKMLGQISGVIKENICAANNSLIGYMEEFTLLDDSKLSEYRNYRDDAERTWNEVQNATTLVKDDEGNEFYIKKYSNYYIEFCKGIFDRLQRLVEKLEGLSSADGEAYNNISNVEGNILSILSAINNIPDDSFSLKLNSDYFTDHSFFNGSLKNGRNYYGFYQEDTHWNSAADNTCYLFAVATAISTVYGDKAFDPNTGNIRITPDAIKAITSEFDSKNGTTNVPIKAGDLYGLDYTNGPDFGTPEHLEQINAILKNGGTLVYNDNSHFKTIVGYDETNDTYTIWDPIDLENNLKQCKKEEVITNTSGGTFSCFTFVGPGQNINEILETSGLDPIDNCTSIFKYNHPDLENNEDVVNSVLNGSLDELNSIGEKYR